MLSKTIGIPARRSPPDPAGVGQGEAQGQSALFHHPAALDLQRQACAQRGGDIGGGQIALVQRQRLDRLALMLAGEILPRAVCLP
jgi:hypothetical protein